MCSSAGTNWLGGLSAVTSMLRPHTSNGLGGTEAAAGAPGTAAGIVVDAQRHHGNTIVLEGPYKHVRTAYLYVGTAACRLRRHMQKKTGGGRPSRPIDRSVQHPYLVTQ